WMTPLLGFTTLLCFGMYAIYFPELYPTRLRTTGTGFCYNVARYIAAAGLILLGYIGTMLELRISTQIFALIYFVGIAAAFLAPETKGRPLAED
ncbi:MAG TPA: MFS transporter, partial [Planctomycetota bacterium]|nr:MFS transporter [Planctomycetota bacterium]